LSEGTGGVGLHAGQDVLVGVDGERGHGVTESFADHLDRHASLDEQRAVGVAVAILRAEAGRDPYDRRLSDLIGELSTRSDEFRVRWASHNVKFHRTGTKHLHHPLVGDLTLTYEAFDLPADAGQRMLAYMAEPDSPSHDALSLLASWTSTPDQQPAVQADEGP
jgi:hypothetical protein